VIEIEGTMGATTAPVGASSMIGGDFFLLERSCLLSPSSATSRIGNVEREFWEQRGNGSIQVRRRIILGFQKNKMDRI